MSDLSVRPVTTEAENQAFLRMPWTVYKDDPNWTAPLWKDHVHFFEPEHTPELQHMTLEKFVAWRGETPVGTILTFINHAYNDYQETNAGWFGQFEVLEDREAAHALLKTAEDWVRAQGAASLLGPATYSTNSELGLLIDGYEHPPMLLTTYAPRYYRDFIESYGGFEKAMDLWAWHFDGNDWGGKKADRLPEKLVRVVGKIRQRRNFVVRPINMRRFEEEVDKVKVIYNQAWSRNWSFVPMSDAEIDALKEELKPMLDTNIVFFVEVEGEPVAFALPLPNLYQPLRKVRCKPGEPHWWQLLRLIWHWKIRRDVNGVRVWALGVLEEYRGTGIDALMYHDLIIKGMRQGYLDIEMSWILEDNIMMNRALEMMGAKIYKTYRVYRKALA
jgi:GNAT superfamily N-acetyltransferase